MKKTNNANKQASKSATSSTGKTPESKKENVVDRNNASKQASKSAAPSNTTESVEASRTEKRKHVVTKDAALPVTKKAKDSLILSSTLESLDRIASSFTPAVVTDNSMKVGPTPPFIIPIELQSKFDEMEATINRLNERVSVLETKALESSASSFKPTKDQQHKIETLWNHFFMDLKKPWGFYNETEKQELAALMAGKSEDEKHIIGEAFFEPILNKRILEAAGVESSNRTALASNIKKYFHNLTGNKFKVKNFSEEAVNYFGNRTPQNYMELLGETDDGLYSRGRMNVPLSLREIFGDRMVQDFLLKVSYKKFESIWTPLSPARVCWECYVTYRVHLALSNVLESDLSRFKRYRLYSRFLLSIEESEWVTVRDDRNQNPQRACTDVQLREADEAGYLIYSSYVL